MENCLMGTVCFTGGGISGQQLHNTVNILNSTELYT